MSVEQPRFGLSAGRTAVFLDVDGTLLGFKDHPDDVVADPPLRRLLERLHDAAGGALALVSGRTIADLDRIMAPLVLPAAGTHGAELRFADGRREAVAGAALDDVQPALAAFVAAHPGTLLENKGAAIAVHYRRAPDLHDRIVGLLEGAVARDDLMIQRGKMVAEIKHRATNKGTAIATMMAGAPFAGRLPLFIGDDLTDEHGFDTVNRLGGMSIKVGEGQTTAHQRLADVECVRAFLEDLSGSGN